MTRLTHLDLDGTVVVPGNRWDLVPASDRRRPISVVVPYHEAPQDLRRLLAGLAAQRHAPIEVIVVDDGSVAAPAREVLAEMRLDGGAPDASDVAMRWETTVIDLPDEGFRAALARNVGAGAATGEVLVFLDADVVPHPELLWHLTALPSSCPDAIVVGRRLHADLDGLTPAQAVDATMSIPPDRRLVDPSWLADAYARTEDLRHVDGGSWRFIISAVLAFDAALFHELGGFDETLVGYGGEDWVLAHRALHAGAVLAHEPRATVVHNGPDLAGRDELDRKDAEYRRLLTRISDPTYAPRWLITEHPRCVVQVDVSGWSENQVVVTTTALLGALPDAVIALAGLARRPGWAQDPRILLGSVDRHHAEVVVDVRRPVRLAERPGAASDLARLTDDVGPGRADVMVLGDPARPVAVLRAAAGIVRARRAEARGATPAQAGSLLHVVTVDLSASPLLPDTGSALLESRLGRVGAPHRTPPVDLAAVAAVMTDAPVPSDEPVFVLSAGWRSGSTLVQRLLLSDPDLWIWGEPLDLIRPLQTLHEQLRPISAAWPTPGHAIPEEDVTGAWVARMSPDVDTLIEAQRAYVRTLLSTGHDRPRWGAKQVRLTADDARWLRLLFPRAKVVLLVRDPVDAWASYAANPGWWLRWPTHAVHESGEFAQRWATLAAGFIDLAATNPAVLLLRYEDLREGGVDALAEHVGARLDPAVLEQRVRGTSSPPVDVSDADAALITEICAHVADRLGYDLDTRPT